MICKYCGEPIATNSGNFIHHSDDGPDAYYSCLCNCSACTAYRSGGQKAYEAVMNESPCVCVEGEEAEPACET